MSGNSANVGPSSRMLSEFIHGMSPSPAAEPAPETLQETDRDEPDDLAQLRNRITELELESIECAPNATTREKELAKIVIRLGATSEQLIAQAEIISSLSSQRDLVVKQAEQERQRFQAERDGWQRMAEALISQRAKSNQLLAGETPRSQEVERLESDNKFLREKLDDTQSRLSCLESELEKLRPILLMQPILNAAASAHPASFPYPAMTGSTAFAMQKTKQQEKARRKLAAAENANAQNATLNPHATRTNGDSEDTSAKRSTRGQTRKLLSQANASKDDTTKDPLGAGKVPPATPITADARMEHILLAARKIGKDRVAVLSGLLHKQDQEPTKSKKDAADAPGSSHYRPQTQTQTPTAVSPKTPKRTTTATPATTVSPASSSSATTTSGAAPLAQPYAALLSYHYTPPPLVPGSPSRGPTSYSFVPAMQSMQGLRNQPVPMFPYPTPSGYAPQIPVTSPGSSGSADAGKAKAKESIDKDAPVKAPLPLPQPKPKLPEPVAAEQSSSSAAATKNPLHSLVDAALSMVNSSPSPAPGPAPAPSQPEPSQTQKRTRSPERVSTSLKRLRLDQNNANTNRRVKSALDLLADEAEIHAAASPRSTTPVAISSSSNSNSKGKERERDTGRRDGDGDDNTVSLTAVSGTRTSRSGRPIREPHSRGEVRSISGPRIIASEPRVIEPPPPPTPAGTAEQQQRPQDGPTPRRVINNVDPPPPPRTSSRLSSSNSVPVRQSPAPSAPPDTENEIEVGDADADGDDDPDLIPQP